MNKMENYANAIYQNANVGKQSINDILPKTEDETLKQELENEYEEYNKITSEIESFAKRNKLEIKENTFFEKAKLWTSIKMSTMLDNSTRHITELLLLGSVMGLTTCYKDRFDHKGTSKELDVILSNLEQVEENNYNQLKKFLKEQLA